MREQTSRTKPIHDNTEELTESLLREPKNIWEVESKLMLSSIINGLNGKDVFEPWLNHKHHKTYPE